MDIYYLIDWLLGLIELIVWLLAPASYLELLVHRQPGDISSLAKTYNATHIVENNTHIKWEINHLRDGEKWRVQAVCTDAKAGAKTDAKTGRLTVSVFEVDEATAVAACIKRFTRIRDRSDTPSSKMSEKHNITELPRTLPGTTFVELRINGTEKY